MKNEVNRFSLEKFDIFTNRSNGSNNFRFSRSQKMSPNRSKVQIKTVNPNQFSFKIISSEYTIKICNLSSGIQCQYVMHSKKWRKTTKTISQKKFVNDSFLPGPAWGGAKLCTLFEAEAWGPLYTGCGRVFKGILGGWGGLGALGGLTATGLWIEPAVCWYTGLFPVLSFDPKIAAANFSKNGSGLALRCSASSSSTTVVGNSASALAKTMLETSIKWHKIFIFRCVFRTWYSSGTLTLE